MSIHFSSKDQTWSTPQNFFDELNIEFKFTLDPCAIPETAKCKKFLTPDDDGLSQDWAPDRVFMNPPYGRAIKHWIKKAFDESQKGALVVCLIPSRTDTVYWHNYVMRGEIRFIKGRLKFGDSKNSAPFPSAIVIFRPFCEASMSDKVSCSSLIQQSELQS